MSETAVSTGMNPDVDVKPPKQDSGRMKRIIKNRAIYMMILPGFLYFLIFKYIPMSGLVIAFQDYQAFLGVMNSPWVGFKHFERLFTEPMFLRY